MDIEEDFEDGYFDSGFGKIHYKSHTGTGLSIVLLHGFAGSTKTWTRIVQHFDQSIGMYLIDLLGHGESDAPDIEYSFGVHYNSVSALIGSLSLRDPFVMGHSYGGWIAARYAEQNRIGGLILEDSAGLKDFYEERLTNNPEYREDLIRRAISLNPRERVLRSMLEADNSDFLLTRSNLEAIDSKTLIIWGGQDTTVATKYAHEFRRYIVGSRLEMLESERHTPHYTNPEAVAKLILEFVS